MSEKPGSPGSLPESQHVLVIEDNPGVRDSMRMALEIAGYEASTASDSAEALDQARTKPDIDAIIADYHLGGSESGTDVIRSIAAILGHEVRAALLTGDISGQAEQAARDQGLKVFYKPIEFDELLNFLNGAEETGA